MNHSKKYDNAEEHYKKHMYRKKLINNFNK